MASPVNIVYVANVSSVHTRKWVGHFAGRGHQVDVFSLEQWPAAPHGVRVHTFVPRRSLNLPAIVLQIRRLCRSARADVLHAHFATGPGLWAALSGIRPFALTAWGSDVLLHPGRSRRARYQTRFVLRRADLLTCDAEHMRAAMARLGADPTRIRLVNFGVDTQAFSPERRDPGWPEQLGFPAGAPVVVSTRSLLPLYDVGTFVDAAALVAASVPRARFVIIGEGGERQNLERRAAQLGLAERVRFLGSVPNAELPRLLASAAVYVSTSLSDGGIASSTAEAMACGLPAVITDFGNNREWVGEGVGGFLTPLRDPATVAARVVTLLDSAETRLRFGRTNRLTIVERNSLAGEMGKVEDLYRSLIGGSR